MLNWIKEYIASPTHQWWVDNVWKPSWTKFTTWVYGIPALAVTAGQAISKIANDTTIASYLDKIGTPNWVPAALSTIAIVYFVATSHE